MRSGSATISPSLCHHCAGLYHLDASANLSQLLCRFKYCDLTACLSHCNGRHQTSNSRANDPDTELFPGHCEGERCDSLRLCIFGYLI